MGVSFINTTGFNAYIFCNFYNGNYEPVTGLVQQGDELVLGPPQEVYAVACMPTPGGGSTCLPEYSTSFAPFLFFKYILKGRAS